MNTPTPPMRIFLCSNPIELTVELDERGELQLLHRGVNLAEHGNGLEISLEDEVPVTVELLDCVDAEKRLWTVEARTVEAKADGANETTAWHRGSRLCHATWRETEEEREVRVTATHEPENAEKLEKSHIFFIRVLPEGAKPWP